MAARRRPRPLRNGVGPVLVLLLAAAGAPGLARGQVSPATAPAADEPDASAGSAPDLPGSRAAAPALDPAPQCGLVTVFAPRCNFVAINRNSLKITMVTPKVTVMGPSRPSTPASISNLPYGRNSLRRLLLATFPADDGNSNVYAAPPPCTVTVTTGRFGSRMLSGTADLYQVREDSVRAHPTPGRPGFPSKMGKYKVKLQRGPDHKDMSNWPTGRCQMVIATPCPDCPAGEADFGAGCVAATATADVCPDGQATFTGEAGCAAAAPTADACPGGTCITAFTDTIDSGGTCILAD